MRRLWTLIIGLAVVGCNQSTSSVPTSPSTQHLPVPILVVAPTVSPAMLDIKNPSAALSVIGGRFLYRIKFQLEETTGQSSATIRQIESWISDEDRDITGIECWGDTGLSVAAASSVLIDDKSLGYCAPVLSSNRQVTGVSLSVEFTDRTGNVQTIRAIAPVTR